VADAIGFAVDLVAALAQRDSETWIYGLHYAHHLRRVLGERARGAPLPTRSRPRRPVLGSARRRPRDLDRHVALAAASP
jgi:hypothetical protein